eukprot:TRINITY_DN30220_c0_g1_i1.p1 TRINITY_DN30220_c0_g1~~TRINITY_DN30220_c0_g1_i1.p1  ORF type:complete len:270 (+),score=44.18 TRINITY_DN30220_c0_g1_i1:70-879(+)
MSARVIAGIAACCLLWSGAAAINSYTLYDHLNVYPPSTGAQVGDCSGDYYHPYTVAQCLTLCDQTSWCQCVTYKTTSSRCWRRDACDPSQGKNQSDFQVYVLIPTAAPTPAPTPSPTALPTRQPTPRPTLQPTHSPTEHPTQSPTACPPPTPQPTPQHNGKTGKACVDTSKIKKYPYSGANCLQTAEYTDSQWSCCAESGIRLWTSWSKTLSDPYEDENDHTCWENVYESGNIWRNPEYNNPSLESETIVQFKDDIYYQIVFLDDDFCV